MTADHDLASGVTVEHPEAQFAGGSILGGVFADLRSAIAYSYENKDIPVYLNKDPVLNVDPVGGGERGGGRGVLNGGLGQNVTPNLTPVHISPLDAAPLPTPTPLAGRGRGSGGRGGGASAAASNARIVLRFPAKADDMLLSGTLAGGETLQDRALTVDFAPGKGQRPFWRWQTQGTYFLEFNAIRNWDHLDAAKRQHPPNPNHQANKKGKQNGV